jgi:hypothetical protein
MGIVGGEVICAAVVLYTQVEYGKWTSQYSFPILLDSNSPSPNQSAAFDFLGFWSGDVYKLWVSTTLGCEKNFKSARPSSLC